MNLKRSVQFLTKTLYTGAYQSFSKKKVKQPLEPNAILYKPSNKVKDQKLTPEAKSALKSDLLDDTLRPDDSKSKLPVELKNLRPQEILKRIDTSIEGFFYKREYNIENFNFLLQSLAEKKDKKGALSAFEKMKELGIVPTRNTYTQLLTACAKGQDAEQAEAIFLEAKKLPGIGVNIAMYNSLMLCYTRRYEPEKALKIFHDMKDEGMKPDVVCYTTLINSFKNTKNVNKVWELYDTMLKDDIMPDENLYGLMIEICAATHDAEKGKNLFQRMSVRGFAETCLPYNALIKALGSRADYAQEALDYYETMLLKGIAPDSDTYIALFKATSSLGDVKTAFNGLINMKNQKLPLTHYHYKGLLRTYAGACKIPQLSQETKDLYIKDAWKLFEQMQTVDKLPVNVHILNSLTLVHTNAVELKQFEDFVLPLYEKYEIQLDQNSYEFMMELYLKLQDLKKVVNLMDNLLQKGIAPTFNTLNAYLETAIRLDHRGKILEGLQLFKKYDKKPKNKYLRILGKAEDIPEDIYIELHGFEKKYGFIDSKTRLLRSPNSRYSSI